MHDWPRLTVICRGLSPDVVDHVADAAVASGIHALEITTNSPETMTSVRRVRGVFASELRVGVGTVRTTDDVRKAIDAGAEFIVSPHVDLSIIRATLEAGLVAIPGAMTPSEILSAYSAGAQYIKLFPAGPLGGAAYLEQVRAPLPDVPILVSGGLALEQARLCIASGAHGALIGAGLIASSAIAAGDWPLVQRKFREYSSGLHDGLSAA